VFDSILNKAQRLCCVDHAALELLDGERMHAVAVHEASEKFAETLRHGYPATESPAGRALLEGGQFVEIGDASQIDHVAFRTAAEVDGIRTVLFVPLRRDGALLGMIASARHEVRPFSAKEITLLQNFAAQAVIAMENARLINEIREALEQQTATAEVLQVINASPGDLRPVFDTMLEKAMRLCGGTIGGIFTFDGDHSVTAAMRGVTAAFAQYNDKYPTDKIQPGGLPARIIETRRPVQYADLTASEPYRAGRPYARAPWNSAASALPSPCPFSRTALQSEWLRSIARRLVRSPTSKSSCCKTLRPKR
jgi:hypothetical protein